MTDCHSFEIDEEYNNIIKYGELSLIPKRKELNIEDIVENWNDMFKSVGSKGFSPFINYSLDVIFNSISYIIGTILYPGLIGVDALDIASVMNNIKNGLCFFNTGYNEITVINDILHRLDIISEELEKFLLWRNNNI